MRIIAMSVAVLALSLNAYADENEFRATTEKALAAGSPAAVVKALDKEAYSGNLIAAYQLGIIYRDGKLVPQDIAKAKKYLKNAASSDMIRWWFRDGLVDAQIALAEIYRTGIGGKPDPAAAESWYTKAAELGNGPAQLALAKMYFNGAGVARNLEQAFVWASLAAATLSDAGQKAAEQIRDQSQAILEPKNVAKAKHQVEKWKPKAS